MDELFTSLARMRIDDLRRTAAAAGRSGRSHEVRRLRRRRSQRDAVVLCSRRLARSEL